MSAAQPSNRRIRAALARALREPSRNTIDALAHLRNRRTTWCGLDELELRAAVDATIREHDERYYS